MIAALAFLSVAQTAPSEPPARRSGDIVVTAIRKLDDWRGALVFQGDDPECKVVKSANDADLDTIGCKSMLQCYDAVRPRLLAVNDRTLAPRARRQKRIDANRDLELCFKTTRRAMVLELYKRKFPDEPVPAQ